MLNVYAPKRKTKQHRHINKLKPMTESIEFVQRKKLHGKTNKRKKKTKQKKNKMPNKISNVF